MQAGGMTQLGLLEHPTAWQLILTVVLVFLLVFLIGLGDKTGQFIKGLFNKRERLGGRYD